MSIATPLARLITKPMNARAIFFDQAGRPRSGWRFLIFLLVFISLVLLVRSVSRFVFLLLSLPYDFESPEFFALNALVMLVPTLVASWLCGKYLEGLPFRALGAWFTEGWLRNFGVGLLLGAATLLVAVLLGIAFGGLRFTSGADDPSLVGRSLGVAFVTFAFAAAFEEAVFRGYILQTFARSGLAALAIGLTSVFFGFVHAGNPEAGWISTANTVLAGVWFGVAYLKTRDLWFVWGMHLVWNWMLGAVFGIEVSGMRHLVDASVLREVDSGPAWVTGTTYGIEGGIVVTIALIVSTVGIYFLPLRPSEEMRVLSSPTYVAGRDAG